jgi:hypothetical protein
MDDATARVDL